VCDCFDSAWCWRISVRTGEVTDAGASSAIVIVTLLIASILVSVGRGWLAALAARRLVGQLDGQ